MPTLNISLTPQLEKLVRDKVESGRYTSASEVVREALRLLEEQDRLRGLQVEALRQEIQRGAESGSSMAWDKHAFLAEARDRLKADREEPS